MRVWAKLAVVNFSFSFSLSSGTLCSSKYNLPQQPSQGWVAWCMSLGNHRWKCQALNTPEVAQGGEWLCKGQHHLAMRPRQADWVGWLTYQWSVLHHGYPWKKRRDIQYSTSANVISNLHSIMFTVHYDSYGRLQNKHICVQYKAGSDLIF